MNATLRIKIINVNRVLIISKSRRWVVEMRVRKHYNEREVTFITEMVPKSELWNSLLEINKT